MSTNEGSPSEANPRKPACDICRARKIRCDKGSPCTNCLASGSECTLANTKPREKRTRILLTPQYEKKIDSIDRRLEDAMRLLGAIDLKVSATSSRTSHISQHTPGSFIRSEKETRISLEHDETDVTLAAHAEMASNFVEDVTTDQGSGYGIQESLDALRETVKSLECSKTDSVTSFPQAAALKHRLAEVSRLPPIEEVVALLRSPPSANLQEMSLAFAFLSTQEFSDLCLGVYFSQDFTIADSIILNAGIISLMNQASYRSQDDRKVLLVHFASLCRANLEAALANLPMYLPPTTTTLIALLCGTSHALSVSKPLLAWTLSAKAAEFCHTLGYDRRKYSLDADDSKKSLSEREFRIFWCAYSMDKFLSLCLRRAPALPNWDVIPSPPPYPDTDQISSLLSNTALGLMVPISRLHGLVYEKLFSPRAATMTQAETCFAVREVLDELHKYRCQLEAWKPSSMEEIHSSTEMMARSCEIMRLSLLVLTQRRLAKATGSLEDDYCAAKTAKEALQSIQDCIALVSRFHPTDARPGILLYAPIPFTALFCYIIQQGDESGLQTLEALTAKLETIPEKAPPLSKMLRLFKQLQTLARQLVESSSRQQAERFTVDIFKEADLVDPMLWLDDMSDLGGWVGNGYS